jgi:hypothetical protein
MICDYETQERWCGFYGESVVPIAEVGSGRDRCPNCNQPTRRSARTNRNEVRRI